MRCSLDLVRVKGTTDAIFIVRQVQEKLLDKQKLWMAFVDSETAFDRVPREVLWWALRHAGVEECRRAGTGGQCFSPPPPQKICVGATYAFCLLPPAKTDRQGA